MNRRQALSRIAGGAVGSLLASTATPAGTTIPAPAGVPGRHRPKPLPFDPTRLRGLSERLIVSHHENNYGGELTFTNSVILHELYFANLGGDGRTGGRILTAPLHPSTSMRFPGTSTGTR